MVRQLRIHFKTKDDAKPIFNQLKFNAGKRDRYFIAKTNEKSGYPYEIVNAKRPRFSLGKPKKVC